MDKLKQKSEHPAAVLLPSMKPHSGPRPKCSNGDSQALATCETSMALGVKVAEPSHALDLWKSYILRRDMN